MGLFPTSIIGLGLLYDSSEILVPKPPANITNVFNMLLDLRFYKRITFETIYLYFFLSGNFVCFCYHIWITTSINHRFR